MLDFSCLFSWVATETKTKICFRVINTKNSKILTRQRSKRTLCGRPKFDHHRDKNCTCSLPPYRSCIEHFGNFLQETNGSLPDIGPLSSCICKGELLVICTNARSNQVHDTGAIIVNTVM